MKRVWANVSAIGAIGTSLAALACCLPPALLGATGFALLGLIPSVLQPWMLTISGGLLVAGVVSAIRGARCGVRPSKWNWILLLVATVFLILALLFPQWIAGFVADYLF